jgi:hypothetical protein
MTVDSTLQELQSELEAKIAEYGTEQPPDAYVSLLADVKQARGQTGDESIDTSSLAQQTTLAAVLDRSLPTGRELIVSYLVATSSGTIAAGAQSWSIANIGTASGLLAGQEFAPGSANVKIENPLDWLPAISYDATGTKFEILVTR